MAELELSESEGRRLYELEVSLWQPETRFDRPRMEKTLAPGFFEFGRSGRKWTREQCLDVSPAPFSVKLPLPEFSVRLVSKDIALATYVSDVDFSGVVEVANRSSVWRRGGPLGWQIVFHQGTPRA